jgi:hypothetical protein
MREAKFCNWDASKSRHAHIRLLLVREANPVCVCVRVCVCACVCVCSEVTLYACVNQSFVNRTKSDYWSIF